MDAKEKLNEAIKRNDIQQFVCFKLAQEEYALDINYVQEVIRIPRITPIPQMPEFVLGVINIRGNVSALFDLRKMFQLEQKEFDNNSKILVANINNVVISMVVDQILENVKLESSQIDPTPTVRMKINRECIRGLGELDGRMIVILDLPEIHDAIKSQIDAKV